MITLISLGAFLATFCGGLFAIKLKDQLHLVLGFSAGAVIGVAFFDLLPEALELGSDYYDPSTITAVVAGGFILFMILDRFVIFHSHSHEHNEHTPQISRGYLGAGSLAIHSFLDGVAVGLAFQVSSAVGLIIATAVLVHDFSDGINSVNLVLKNGGTKAQALKWLSVDAIAPVLGIVSTLFFTLPTQALGLIRALFCGSFIYIGASDLLPESHHSHPTRLTTITTIVGMAVMYLAIKLAGL